MVSFKLGVLGDYKKALFLRKGKEEHLGNYRLGRLTSVSESVTEQILPEAISKHMKDKKLMVSSQYGFIKGKPCLNNLISFL